MFINNIYLSNFLSHAYSLLRTKLDQLNVD